MQPSPPQVAQDVNVKVVEFPLITDWLKYCDQHPECRGQKLSALLGKLKQDGYRHIHHITSARTSAEKLSGWLGIGRGTADMLIQYADEDVALVRAGIFTTAAAVGQNSDQSE
jgi:hypothetical protein